MTYSIGEEIDGYLCVVTCDICGEKHPAIYPDDPAMDPPLDICSTCNN